jgi:hypothetical protein
VKLRWIWGVLRASIASANLEAGRNERTDSEQMRTEHLVRVFEEKNGHSANLQARATDDSSKMVHDWNFPNLIFDDAEEP